MTTEILTTLFARDLEQLKTELNQYPDEQSIWLVQKGITNSAGNLCLHLVGNLNTFIGAMLGNTGYVRHRELEFSSRDVPKDELFNKIDDTIQMIKLVLNTLTGERLDQQFPKVVFDKPTTTAYMLIHLSTHLSYHLGQVNYHRRILTV